MQVVECKIEDLLKVKGSTTSSFLAHSIGGAYRDQETYRSLALLARLTDKAVSEYKHAYQAFIKESTPRKLSFVGKIFDKGGGIILYTNVISNHLENAINALVRAYKVIDNIKAVARDQSSKIRNIRNTIEHMDVRIHNNIPGPISLIMSPDALMIEVANERLNTSDLVSEIVYMHRETMTLLREKSSF